MSGAETEKSSFKFPVSSFECKQPSLRDCGGFLVSDLKRKLLLHFQENNRQRIQCQRLDQHETENQRELDSRTRSRVPCQRLGGRRYSFALGKAADGGSDRHGKSGGDGDPACLT